jgi:hypothetical protein
MKNQKLLEASFSVLTEAFTPSFLSSSYDTPEEAKAAAMKYVKQNGGTIEFDGMNCNDYLEDNQAECDGWDGDDRRCECGNRRVSWDIEKNLKGKFIAVARAY